MRSGRLATVGLLSGPASIVRYAAVKRGGPLRRAFTSGSPPAAALRMRALDGGRIHVRPGTSDLEVLHEGFVRGYAAPPAELSGRRLATIAEFGTNIGVGLAALAHAHPGARLLGVEPDRDNVQIARRNLAPFADRCEIVHAAVWPADVPVTVDRADGWSTGFTVAEDGGGDEVEGCTAASLLARLGPKAVVDYLYIDVEGAHASLLRGETAWLDRVRAVKVAGHDGTNYSEADCARDLQARGFRTRIIAFDPIGWTVGVRP